MDFNFVFTKIGREAANLGGARKICDEERLARPHQLLDFISDAAGVNHRRLLLVVGNDDIGRHWSAIGLLIMGERGFRVWKRVWCVSD